MGKVALELRGIRKTFPGASPDLPVVRAVRDASMRFEVGTISFLCGENGAGKSTVLRGGAGLLDPDAGQVEVYGRPLARGRRAAGDAGVAMVEQHFALADRLTALENIVLGHEPRRGPTVDWAAATSRIRELERTLGTHLRLDAEVGSLGVGDRQRVEITRALFRDARVLILDEPTAVLTPSEATALYETLGALASAGRAVVVVTHKLEEVAAHAGCVVVMRHGEVTFAWTNAQGPRPEIDEIAREIMGREAPTALAIERQERGGLALRLRGVAVGSALRGIDLELHEREIVGVAGVEGNGQRELVDVLAGAPHAGEVTPAPTPGRVRVVHEDRQRDGLVLDASVRDNLVLDALGGLTRRGMLDVAAMTREASRRLAAIGAELPLDAPARQLSGGNQQKVVMARALAAKDMAVLVCAHPSRGVDVAAQAALWREIVRARDEGVAVLIVSADLRELRALASRIIVFYKGRIVAELPPTASDEDLGRAMLGLSDGAAA